MFLFSIASIEFESLVSELSKEEAVEEVLCVELVPELVLASKASMTLVYMKSRVAALFTVDKHVWMLVARRCLMRSLLQLSQ